MISAFKIEELLNRELFQFNTVNFSKKVFQKTILVTGGAGSIGSEIVRQLATFKPKKIIVLDQAETPLYLFHLEIENTFPDLSIIPVIMDIRNKKSVENVFKTHSPNIVFHAAAYKHVPLMELFPSEAISTNIVGTKIITDLSNSYKVEKFIFISTDKAVSPSSVMGASKRISELYINALQNYANSISDKTTSFIIVRFGNVLGTNGSLIPLLTKQIESGGPVTVTHPNVSRYFVTKEEAVQFVFEAVSINEGSLFVLDMGQAIKIIDLVKKMIILAGLKTDKDISIKITGLRPGEKLEEALFLKEDKVTNAKNEKILIVEEVIYDYKTINNQIAELKHLERLRDDSVIIEKMKEIVPEFVSMNSKFEQFDISKERIK